jgi:hypothetical protein
MLRKTDEVVKEKHFTGCIDDDFPRRTLLGQQRKSPPFNFVAIIVPDGFFAKSTMRG